MQWRLAESVMAKYVMQRRRRINGVSFINGVVARQYSIVASGLANVARLRLAGSKPMAANVEKTV